MIWRGGFGSHSNSWIFRGTGLWGGPCWWSTMPQWWNPIKVWTPGLVWASLVAITQYLLSCNDARKVILPLTLLWEDNWNIQHLLGLYSKSLPLADINQYPSAAIICNYECNSFLETTLTYKTLCLEYIISFSNILLFGLGWVLLKHFYSYLMKRAINSRLNIMPLKSSLRFLMLWVLPSLTFVSFWWLVRKRDESI